MKFEEALVAMRVGRIVRVPALLAGNREYFYRLVNVGVHEGFPHIGVSDRLDKEHGRWFVCSVGSSTLLREDFELVPEQSAPVGSVSS